MKRFHVLAVVPILVFFFASPSVASTDYSDAANWICRPGNERVCTTGFDASIVGPNEAPRSLPFVPAADPTIDCFYVYPTVSNEETIYSDLKQSPEVVDAVAKQAGRLSSRCRVFAPVYHQVTDYGIQQLFNGAPNVDFKAPFVDVVAAWRYYLAHDNNGRGVVLIGHSQGTILLQGLIASEIDGRAQQKLLVSAFLAGDPSLAVPVGKKVGGTFTHVPVCSSKAETGCAYVWASYLQGDDSRTHYFGKPLDGGKESACESPAAPSGGIGSLEFFHLKAKDAPASDPPWVETVDQFSGSCHTDATGSSFVVTVGPGPDHDSYLERMKGAVIAPGWGLHIEDVALELGNILDVLDAEIATWKAHAAP